ncbi:MAG: MerR family transcriptional regulator [Chloroflexota bacterium]
MGIQRNLLSKLRLSVGEAARISGISVRQLGYWTEKGLVKATGTPSRKRYDFRALERIALIKHFLNEGYSLEEAASQTATWLKARPLGDAEARDVILQHLGELDRLVASLRQRLVDAENHPRLAASARKLTQLNLRALFDERPGMRASAVELAGQLGVAADSVRAALDALVQEGALLRQGRTYRAKSVARA